MSARVWRRVPGVGGMGRENAVHQHRKTPKLVANLEN